MTKRVWIFGDSYADPNWDKESFEHKTWYEMLAKQYEYKNFAMVGTGPHYSMKEFYRRYKQFNEEQQNLYEFTAHKNYVKSQADRSPNDDVSV